MKQISIFAFVFCLLMTTCLAQIKPEISNPEPGFITSSQATSKMTTDYSSVPKFKTVSRKKEYRIGVLISIDIAMLNKSNDSIYFLELGRWASILVRDSNGNEITAGNYIHPLIGPKFNLIGSGDYDSSSFLYLIGCDDIRKEDSYNRPLAKFRIKAI